MRIAIISDIHANLKALEAVLIQIKKLCVDEIVCLGDIVGFGTTPNECVELIKENVKTSLIGDIDWAILGKVNLAYLNTIIKEAVFSAQRRISDETEAFLKKLPFKYITHNCTFVHSAPFEPQSWTYILNKIDAQFQFNKMETQLCFVGNTHIQVIFRKKEKQITLHNKPTIQIEENAKYIINVGAVSQPGSSESRASFGMIDLKKKIFEFHKTEYDNTSKHIQIETFRNNNHLTERYGY